MKLLKTTLLCLGLYFLNGQNYALATLWENSSGLSSGDFGVQGVLTSNDVYYELGVEIEGNGNHHLTLMKFVDNKQIWSTTIHSSNLVGYTPTKLIFENGTIYGAAFQDDNGAPKSFLFSISETGAINWQQTALVENIVTDMIIDSNEDHLILVGTGHNNLTLSKDAFIESRELNGSLNWRQDMDQYGHRDIALEVALDGLNYLIIGSSESGSQQWEMASWYVTVDGVYISYVSGNVVSSNLEQLSDGSLSTMGVVLVGETVNSNQQDFAVYSYDKSHTLLWQDAYDRQGLSDVATGIQISSVGNVLVSGSAEASATGKDVIVRAYSSSGSLLWNSIIDFNEEDDVAVDIIEDNEGNILVLCNSKREGQNDVMLLSLNPGTGIEQWRTRVSTSSLNEDLASKLQVSPSGEIWITYQENSQNSVVVLKYEELLFPNDFEPKSRSNLFVENRGQLMDDSNNPINSVRYYSLGNPTPYYFEDDKFIALFKDNDTSLAVQRVDFSFIGSNGNPISAIESSHAETYFNYYDNSEAYESAETYKILAYPNVYPNIDAYASSNSEGLKISFLLNEGAQLSDIEIEIEGASGTSLQNGDLVVQTLGNGPGFVEPFSYDNDGSLIDDDCIEYDLANGILRLTAINCEISFPYVIHLRTGVGQQNSTVAIDNMDWSTFYGGSRREVANDLVINQTNGDIFIAGSSESNNLPSTTGIGQISNIKLRGLVLKFDKDAELKWGFIQGASNSPNGSLGHLTFKAVQIEDNLPIIGNEIHLVGEYNGGLNTFAPSSAIPSGSYQQQNNAISGLINIPGSSPPLSKFDRDLVIISLNSAGNLIFRTPFGGNGIEHVHTSHVRNGHLYFGGSTDNGSSTSASSSLPPTTHVFPVYNPTDGSYWRAVHPSPGNNRAFITALDLTTYQLSYSSIITKSSTTNSDYTAIYNMRGDSYVGQSINGARLGSFDNGRMFSSTLNYSNTEDLNRDYYSDVILGTSPNGDVDLYHLGLVAPQGGGNPPLATTSFNNSYSSTTGEAYIIKRREAAVNWDTYFGPNQGQDYYWDFTGGLGGPYFDTPDSKGKMAYSVKSSTLFVGASCANNAPTKALPGFFHENVNDNNLIGSKADIYLSAFSSNSTNRSDYFNWGTMYGESGVGGGGLGDFYGLDFFTDMELYEDGNTEYLYVLGTSGSSNGSLTSNVNLFPVADLGQPNSYFQSNGGGLYDIILTRFDVSDIGTGLSNKEFNLGPMAFTLYPNPNKGRFEVYPADGQVISELSVYSLQGVLVNNWEFDDSKVPVQIDISGVTKGVYLLKVNNQYGIKVVID